MNRKVFYTILGMTILCGLFFFRSGNSLAANQTGIVTASSLNVRTGYLLPMIFYSITMPMFCWRKKIK